MNFDPKNFALDFRPPITEGAPAALIRVLAEESIVEAMEAKSQSGLRIIRHLMSKTNGHSLPDFNDRETLRFLARQFIQDAGSGVSAIAFMNAGND